MKRKKLLTILENIDHLESISNRSNGDDGISPVPIETTISISKFSSSLLLSYKSIMKKFFLNKIFNSKITIIIMTDIILSACFIDSISVNRSNVGLLATSPPRFFKKKKLVIKTNSIQLPSIYCSH